MKVKPKENYKLVNYPDNTALDKNKVYDADIAYNQPEYIEKCKIFVEGILLERDDYIIIDE